MSKRHRAKFLHKSNFWVSLASIVVAGSSIWVSIEALNNANKQFKILNQSYIHFEPLIEFSDSTGSRVSKMSSDTLIGTVSFPFRLTNVGNVPAKYVIRKYDFHSLGPIASIARLDTSLIYPKQSIEFIGHSEYYHPPIPVASVLSNFYSFSVRIEYWDINDPGIKKAVERGFTMDPWDPTRSGNQSIHDKVE